MKTETIYLKSGITVQKIVLRLFFFSGLWWVFNPLDLDSWLVGGPTVLLCVLVSLAVIAPARPPFRLVAALAFLGYFILNTLTSSVDVALRALHPSLPLNPGVVEYSLRLRETSAVIFIANITTLLPGTLAADLRGGVLVLHTLDVQKPIVHDLQKLEIYVARMFGLELEEA